MKGKNSLSRNLHNFGLEIFQMGKSHADIIQRYN